MNKLIIFICVSFLIGCNTQPRIKTEYQDVYVPVPVIPNPPVIEKPDFYANQLTEEQKAIIGELSKAYVISSKESVNYTANLEKVYNLWVDLAAKSTARIEALKNMGITIDESLLQQTANEIHQQLQALSLEIQKADEESKEEIKQSLGEMNE